MPSSALAAHDVDRIHVPFLVVEIVALRIAEIEAALPIQIQRRRHHINAFRLPIDCGLLRRVVAIAHPRRDRNAIHLVPINRRWQSIRNRGDILSIRPRPMRRTALRRKRHVVMIGRLIEQLGDRAGRLRAKLILLRRIRIAVTPHANLCLRFIRLARHLIKRPAVPLVQGTRRADRSHTRRRRSIEITRTIRLLLRRSSSGQRNREAKK
jgi:hypothetical protein